MAYCPRCKGVMAATEATCSHCVYDFPLSEPRTGLAYSRLADVALVVGIVVAGLGSVAAAVGSIVALLHGEWSEGLVVGPIAFFLQLALLVVFVRVQKL